MALVFPERKGDTIREDIAAWPSFLLGGLVET
jgi:hypothetical protein